MKQFFKMFFASLLAMIVAGVIIFGVIIGLIIGAVSSSMSAKKDIQVKSNSVLYVDLKKRFHEQTEKNSLAILSGSDGYSPGLFKIIQSIENAKTDDKINGIVIRLNPSQNGWATLNQLRTAIKEFKTSGKFVYAYGEDIPQNAYYVATVADSIYVNPLGAVELKGFATVLAFFKGTLDKLEIEPEIFYAGKFKSATEPFRVKQMSDANREQIAAFQQDFWSEFVQVVAERMGTDTAAVTALARSGAVEFAKDALAHKMVDGILYADQVETRIRKQLGIEEDKSINYIELGEYAENVSADRSKDDRVAVLIAEGQIVDGEADDYQIGSKDMVSAIRKVRKNDKVKAVVLRVNSPGGSALASEIILRELELLQKEKPLVVSMGDVAASGGYFISCKADSIFVMPNTITGSIGVFTMLFNTEKLFNNKLGVTFDGVKNAPYADFPNGIRNLTEQERQKMQRSVDFIYNIFKTHVNKGRRMSMEAVDEIAQGRVWTGTDAVENGLVDGVGDINRAISSAAALADLLEYSVVTYPEPVDKFENLLKKMKGNPAMDEAVRKSIEQHIGDDYEILNQIKQLKYMNGKNMMLLPMNIEVR